MSAAAGAGAGGASSSPILTRAMQALEAETVEELKIGLKSAPLSEWIAEEERFKTALAGYSMPRKAGATRSNNVANIPGLRCSTNPNTSRISFDVSEFANLTDSIKDMSIGFQENVHIPAYTTLLADQQHMFYRYFTYIRDSLYKGFKAHIKEPLDTDLLYGGHYDEQIGGFESGLVKSAFTHYAHLAPVIEALIRRDSNPLCVSIPYFSPPLTLHNVAAVFWKKGGVYYGGFFDPLYFVRSTKRYDECLQALYVTVKILFRHLHNADIRLVNLSQFCFKEAAGKNCLQYVMDAEYCTAYSFYFMYIYAKSGYTTDFVGSNTFARVVHDTFIVNPAQLKRNVCKATNIFKLRFMNFIVNLILRYTNNPASLEHTVAMYDEIQSNTGLALAPEPLIDVARLVVDAYQANRRKTRPVSSLLDDLLGTTPVIRKKTPPNRNSGGGYTRKFKTQVHRKTRSSTRRFRK